MYLFMKKLLIAILFFTSAAAYAQKNKGIRFENTLTWAQVKAKAKKENKYIFIDGFTTWCVPCRKMAAEIFPQQKVGAFFNKNFINVPVQFDQSKNDNAQVKRWYADAKMLATQYKVDLYPTFLFFAPNGSLVHVIKGGTNSSDMFIANAKLALNPSTQFITLKKQFDAGKRDTSFLLRAVTSAQKTNNEAFAITAINAYLPTQKELLTAQNIRFIVAATSGSTDPGFNTLRSHPDKVDAIAGQGKSALLVNDIAFDEVVLPLLRNGGKKTNYGGGMIMYSGELNKNVDWAAVKSKLDINYADQADDIIVGAKPVYYQWLEDWPSFVSAVTAYTGKPKGFDKDKLNSFAWTVFSASDDKQFLKTATDWTKLLLADDANNLFYLNTYANLLYKSGEKDMAINEVEKMIKLSGTENENLVNQLALMKKGEKTW
ncbi:Thioredoxin-related protein [Mucilaginibacter pineti]|uniref:Thioredoxin-related protein n=2 Tax=Mucilaginibacter pineti TaxID=1391627 RepID=A0A1G6SZ19_9SPHI|nr:Thioredoxin-related protein [Mucilaginibacter pineti]